VREPIKLPFGVVNG